MASITLLAAGSTKPLRVISIRLLHPWRGAWLADLEVDLDAGSPAPASGKVTILVTPIVGSPTFTLQGTVDPRGSGGFNELYHLRVIAGGAGWDQAVPRQHFHSDGNLRDVDVYSATASVVGEVVNVPTPTTLTTDFFRAVGPASQVFDGLDYYLDAAGVTQVGVRPAGVADVTLEVETWDAGSQVAKLACQGLLVPGTALTDTRIGTAPVIVRDVEQVFDASGGRATAWCGVSPTTQLMNDLRSMVREFSGRRFLQTYEYRIVQQNSDGRLQLQAVNAADGAPDSLPLPPWTGLSGASAKYLPGTLVRVAFFHGDPKRPLVDLYDPTSLPLESTVDASAVVNVGPSAPSVQLAGGVTPIALAPPLTTFLSALQTWSAAVAGALTSAGFPIATAQFALVAAIGTATSNIPAIKTTAT